MSLTQSGTANLADDAKNTAVLVKYYGARFPMLDLYPNILSLKKVPADYVYVPIFNIIFLIVLLALFIWSGIKVRKFLHVAGEKAKEITGRGGG